MESQKNKKDENNSSLVSSEESFNNTKKEHYMNSLNLDAKASMKSRILVGIVLVLVVVPCLILGNHVFAALIFVASIISCHEIINTPQSIERRFSNILYIFAYIMMIVMVYWSIIRNNLVSLTDNPDNYSYDLALDFEGIRITAAGFFVSMSFFFFTTLFDKKFTMSDCFYFIGMILIVSVGFQSILFLRYSPFTYTNQSYLSSDPGFRYGQSMLLIFFMLLGTCMNDVGAYFIGVLFGKHKMCPHISPKKTWEGFFGGVIISLICTLSFAFILDACNLPILEGVIDSEHWYNILILSFLIPIFGVFGDLIFSQIKRTYKIKDFGKALKSHGGVLDRLDSILVVSIALSLMIEIMANGWSLFN